ncbi:MAG: hypothetical protein ACTS2F_14580 [Thainema sp.]
MKLGRTATRLTCAALLSFSMVLPTNPASASTPLTRAVIEALRNQVRLLQENQSTRPANVSDTITPGDGVATGQFSLAELRFNDGSLARVGEQVVFWFTPQTRSFRLSNGTLLMLIPPGRGGTRIHTPNVTTGIRGSALFVRHDAETNTTLVGALTDSGIEVTNADNTERLELQAGQMAVVVENTIQQLYEFDLDTFYQTSPLVEGLKLNQAVTDDEMEASSEEERAIAAVRAETVIALQTQQFNQDTAVATQVFELDAQRTTTSDTPDTADSVGVDTIEAPVSTDLNQITTDVTVPLEGVVNGVVDSVADDLVDAVVDDAINDVGNAVDGVGNVADDVGNIPVVGNSPIDDIVEGVVDVTEGAIDNTVDTVDDLVEGPDIVPDADLMDLINEGVFPGQGNGVEDGFPGQGNGVLDGFPGRGNGVQNGNSGQGNNGVGNGNGMGNDNPGGNNGVGNSVGNGNQGGNNGVDNGVGNGIGNGNQGGNGIGNGNNSLGNGLVNDLGNGLRNGLGNGLGNGLSNGNGRNN